MKFTRSWLGDHLDTDADCDSIAARLTMLGLEVEDMQDPARALRPFSVAVVLDAKPHPNADTLTLCRVQTAGGEGSAPAEVQIICGAPNVRAGMRAVFAPPGCIIPATGKVLTAASIRGVESRGMLCSEYELGLSNDHDAIIELGEDAPLGAAFAAVAGLDDVLFHINLTPNRPDCLGVRGIARELAAAGLGALRPDTLESPPGAFACPVDIALESQGEAAAPPCSLFVARYVRGVSNRPSPPWMQRRLRAIGLRPIDALVDVTNYVAFDRARPLHVYDADKLRGGVRARLGRKGEHFAALDGRDYDIDEDMCVIADDNGVLGLGGIIGGESSAIGADSSNILIESALFDAPRIHRTGRRLGIASDARHRFERGVDPAFAAAGCDYGAALILSLCGGETSLPAQAGAMPPPPVPVVLPRGACKRISGVDFSAGEIAETLDALGFAVVRSDGKGKKGKESREDVQATPPSWRPDITIPADLVEEVLRVRGVDLIESAPLPAQPAQQQPALAEQQGRLRRIRRVLAGRGMMEAVLYSFLSAEDARHFRPRDSANNAEAALRLANPISTAMNVMRPGLLPGLARALQRNLDRGAENLALFESGNIWPASEAEQQQWQQFCVAGLRHGLVGGGGYGRDWRTPGATANAFDAKADVCSVLQDLGVPVQQLRCAAPAPHWYHPHRSGVLSLDPRLPLACFGELHPALVEEMGIAGSVAAFELFIDALPTMSRRQSPLRLSDLPLVRRDFAFVVARETRAEDLLRAVRAADKQTIAAVRLFDVFTGGDLGEGEKSLAMEVVFRPGERTFRDQEIRALCDKVVAAAAAVGASLRGAAS